MLIFFMFRAIFELPPVLQDHIYKGIIQVMALNSCLIIRQLRLSEQVSVFLFIVLIAATMYLVHISFKYFTSQKHGMSANPPSLMPSPSDGTSQRLPGRRNSLQLGLDVISEVERKMRFAEDAEHSVESFDLYSVSSSNSISSADSDNDGTDASYSDIVMTCSTEDDATIHSSDNSELTDESGIHFSVSSEITVSTASSETSD